MAHRTSPVNGPSKKAGKKSGFFRAKKFRPILEWMEERITPTTQVAYFQNGEPVLVATQGSFTEGAIYTGTQDTEIQETTPSTNFGSSSTFAVGPGSQTLIQFSNLFGDSLIPTDSLIAQAKVYVKPTIGGIDGGQLVQLNQPWDEATATWDSPLLSGNNGSGGIQTDGNEAVTGSFPRTNTTDRIFFDVTSSLQQWQENPSENFGWAIIPVNGNSSEFFSSNNSTIDLLGTFFDIISGDKPYLEVTFEADVPPPVEPVSITGDFDTPLVEGHSRTFTVELTGPPIEDGKTVEIKAFPDTVQFDTSDTLLTTEDANVELTFDGSNLDIIARTNQPIEEDFELREVVFHGGQASKQIRPAGSEFDFIGPAGSEVYILPGAQSVDELFLGFGASDILPGIFDGPLEIEILNYAGPGKFSVYKLDQNSQPDVVVRASLEQGVNQIDKTIPINPGISEKYYFAFHESGIRQIDIVAKGTLLDGTKVRSEQAIWTFEIEDNFLAVGQADLDVQLNNQELELNVEYDAGNGNGPQQANLDEVKFFAGLSSQQVRPNGEDYNFLGVPEGEMVYVLPESRDFSKLFLNVTASNIPLGLVTMALQDVRGPGEFSVYQNDPGFPPIIAFSTQDGIDDTDQILLNAGAQKTYNWAFSKTGTYEVDVQLLGNFQGIGDVQSDLVTLTFQVGGTESNPVTEIIFEATEDGSLPPPQTFTLTARDDGIDELDPHFGQIAFFTATLDFFYVQFPILTPRSVPIIDPTENSPPIAENDEFTTDEETAIGGDLFADNGFDIDFDPDDDPIRIVEVNDITLSGGTFSDGPLTVDEGGSFSFDPRGLFDHIPMDETVTETFTYTISDGFLTDKATVTITINGINDPPEAKDDLFETDQHTPVSGNVTEDNGFGIDFDLDVPTDLTVIEINNLTFTPGTPITLPSGALLTIEANGDMTYDPNGQFDDLETDTVETDSFDYTITDDIETDEATVTIEIIGVNDKPDAKDDDFETDEESEITGNIVTIDNGHGVDEDPEDDPLVVTLVNETPLVDGTFTAGPITVNEDGSFSYNPKGFWDQIPLGESELDTFTYTISDGNLTDQATVSITINGLNDPPVAEDDKFITDQHTPVSGNLLEDNGFGMDSDLDVPSTLTVVEINGQPFIPNTTITLPSGALLFIESDGDIAYDPNGRFDFVPTGVSFPDSFDYTLSDGIETDEATVTIDIFGVNDKPDAKDDDFVTDEDTNVVGNIITGDNGHGEDTDPENDPLKVVAVDNIPFAGIFNDGPLTIQEDGTIIFDTFAAVGDLSVGEEVPFDFTYTISDGEFTDEADISILVIGLNDPPVAFDDLYVTDKETPESGNLLVDNGFGPDVDDDGPLPLIVSQIEEQPFFPGVPVVLPSGALVTVDASGDFTYDPNGQFDDLQDGEFATDSFTYTIDDGLDFDIGEATITIFGLNEPPEPKDDDFSIKETTFLTGDLFSDNGNGPDTDPNGDSFSITKVNDLLLTDGQFVDGGLTVNSDGSFSFNPSQFVGTLAEDEVELFTFDYTISDSQFEAKADVEIAITGVNDFPKGINDDYKVDEDSILNENVLALDTDANGDPLMVSSVRIDGIPMDVPEEGLNTELFGAPLFVHPNGDITFTAAGHFDGLVEGNVSNPFFDYTLTDGMDTDTAMVSIEVLGVNDEPKFEQDPYNFSVEENPSSTFVGQVIANDPDSGDFLTYSIDSGNENGIFAIDSFTGIISVAKPDQLDFENGPQSYTLMVSVVDSFTGSDSTTVNINILNVNEAPANLAFNVAGLQEGINDEVVVGFLAAEDQDANDTVTFVLVGGQDFFQVVGNEVRTKAGNPLNFEDSPTIDFTVEAFDSNFNSISETFTLDIGNDAPTAPIDSDTVENTIFVDAANGSTVGIRASSQDPGGGVVTYNLTDDAGGVFAIDTVTGIVTIADSDLIAGPGNLTITVEASDGLLTSSAASFTIEVTEQPDGPAFQGPDGKVFVNGNDEDDLIIVRDGQDGKVEVSISPIEEGQNNLNTPFSQLAPNSRKISKRLRTTRKNAVAPVPNPNVQTWLFSDVTGFAINGNGGNDNVQVEAWVPAEIFGGPGNDTLQGGSGNDLIDGGPGDDSLNGKAGNDILLGGLGKNSLADSDGANAFFDLTSSEIPGQVNEGANLLFHGTFFSNSSLSASLNISQNGNPVADIDFAAGQNIWNESLVAGDGPGQEEITLTLTVNNGTPRTTEIPFAYEVLNVAPTAIFGHQISPENNSATVSFTKPKDLSAEDVTAGFTYQYKFEETGSFVEGIAIEPVPQDILNLLFSGQVDSLKIDGRIIDKDGGFTDYSTVLIPGLDPKIEDIKVGDGTGQISSVKNVKVMFNTIVEVESDAFTLSGPSGTGSNVNLSVQTETVSNKTEANITFSGPEVKGGSLPDGKYTLEVIKENIQANGMSLESNVSQEITRIFGDHNGDGFVGLDDLQAFRDSYRSELGDANYLDYFDFDSDGDIDHRDYFEFLKRFKLFL